MAVVIDQASDLDPRVSHAEAQRLIEKVVEHPPIKAVAEPVLHRLARRELMSFHTHLPASWQYFVAGELGVVIADNYSRLAALDECLAQFLAKLALKRRALDISKSPYFDVQL